LSDFGFICKIPQKHSISVLSGLDKLEAESIMYERINQFIKYQRRVSGFNFPACIVIITLVFIDPGRGRGASQLEKAAKSARKKHIEIGLYSIAWVLQ
jgi:hypothetical protein